MSPSKRPQPLQGKQVVLGVLALAVLITAAVVTVALVTQRPATVVAPSQPTSVVAPSAPRWSSPP